jgi:hypothetical protein
MRAPDIYPQDTFGGNLKTVQSGNKDEKQSVNGEEKRGRGRPRKDGMIPGWVEPKKDSVVGAIKNDEPSKAETLRNVPATEQAQEFSEMEANALLDLLQGIEQPMASKIYGVPYEITRQAFVFTDDMRKRINPAMVKILNKWAPTILRNWKDELGFVLVFGSALNMQVQTMHHLESKRKKEIAAPVTPIRPETPKPEKTETKSPESSLRLEAKEGLNLDTVGVG